jgi:isoaspartyl peptidase/L-asparaginase-like protein (Ntn-hydrolase superfamily)
MRLPGKVISSPFIGTGAGFWCGKTSCETIGNIVLKKIWYCGKEAKFDFKVLLPRGGMG